jgi:hypothetical protein
MDEQFGTLTTGIVVGEDHKERLDRAWREPEFQRTGISTKATL